MHMHMTEAWRAIHHFHRASPNAGIFPSFSSFVDGGSPRLTLTYLADIMRSLRYITMLPSSSLQSQDFPEDAGIANCPFN